MSRPIEIDLLLTKLMRDDPLDLADALFIVSQAHLQEVDIVAALQDARIPAIPELEEQFARASAKLLHTIRTQECKL